MGISNNSSVAACRYRGDASLLETIQATPALAQRMTQVDALRRRHSLRANLLASAVRVDLKLVPRVASSFAQLADRLALTAPMEAYVFEQSSINAFVAQGHKHLLVALSSGAVNGLTEQELDFVIGHELGHALFRHVDVPVGMVLQTTDLSPRDRMLLCAWQRASEISADRVGYLCCGSLDVAATAIFKTISGLTNTASQLSALEFANQWDYLEREVAADGGDDHWQMTHPFPPLRMKAMIAFAECGFANGLAQPLTDAKEDCRQHADATVDRLLALMDPLARDSDGSHDPILAGFILWGGLYMSVASGGLAETERAHLATVTDPTDFANALHDGVPSRELCLSRFQACVDNRRKKLRAREIHRIMQGLLQVAIADGEISEDEINALEELGAKLGVGRAGCEVLISQFLKEG